MSLKLSFDANRLIYSVSSPIVTDKNEKIHAILPMTSLRQIARHLSALLSPFNG